MANYTQDGRSLAITTPLGKDVLLLERLSGREAISDLFRFQLELLHEGTDEIAFDKILGQAVTVTVAPANRAARYFSGIVCRFSQGSRTRTLKGGTSFTRYRAEVVPKLWLLTRRMRSRIFQQKSVPDILKECLEGIDTSYSLQGTFPSRDYCTQYGESDLQFVSRLMEEEGIFYFFKHTQGGHQMVVANTSQAHPDLAGTSNLIYEEVYTATWENERVRNWVRQQEIRSGKSTLWDHCFELPGQNLQASQTVIDSVGVGTLSQKLKVAANDQLEIYEYPGRYAQRFDGVAPGGGDRDSDVQKIFSDNARTAGILMQRETAAGVFIEGESDCRNLSAGHKFKLEQHFNANGSYVVVSVDHSASVEGAYTKGDTESYSYRNTFQCIPSSLPFRPQRQTPCARIDGPQTAVVVGPAGEEIFTDKYGRVKVQFNWDREGTKDTNSSCWVRVATMWAGKQWGAIHIPRIGQEVVVAFEEGDPDQPIIVGTVYNAEQMPPYTLPTNKTQSGIKSRSSLNGDAECFNELRFEDKKDSEDVYFHAQKDFHRVVENDDDLKVGHDQTMEIKNNRTETVKEGDEKVTIEKGNRTHKVKQDDSLTIEGKQIVEVTGNRTITVKQGNESVTISQGNRTVEIKMGNDSTTVSLGKSSLEAMQAIELKVGQSSIKIDPAGITLQAMVIKLQGQVQVMVQAPITQVKADGLLQLKGGVTMIG